MKFHWEDDKVVTLVMDIEVEKRFYFLSLKVDKDESPIQARSIKMKTEMIAEVNIFVLG